MLFMQCFVASWFMSCYVQFMIVGIIIIYVYKMNNKHGIALLGVIISASISVPFIVTYLKELEGMLIMDLR